MSKWNFKIVNNQENMTGKVYTPFEVIKIGINSRNSKQVAVQIDRPGFVKIYDDLSYEERAEISRIIAEKFRNKTDTETAPSNSYELFKSIKRELKRVPDTGSFGGFEKQKNNPSFMEGYNKLTHQEQEEIKKILDESASIAIQKINEMNKNVEEESKLEQERTKNPPPIPPPIPVYVMQSLGDGLLNNMKMKYYQLMQTISKSSLSIEEYETKISGSLVQAMSGKNHTNDDIILVKKHFASFLSLSVSCFVVYNWFYVMYFINKSGERVKTLELSLTKIKQNSPILHFFFKYILCVLSMMDKLVIDIVPSTVSFISIDRRIQFITLFVLVYMIINNFGSIILNSVDSKTVVSAYVCIFVLYELYCVLTDFLPDEKGSIDISRLHKYMVFGTVTPLLYLLLFFVRMVWSIAFIGVASFINCAYILIMSFFSILVYSSSFFGTFKILNEFIWESKDSKSGPIEVCLNILYRFLYEISFILILLLGISDYSSNMSKTSQMSTIISCICSMFIFLFAFIAYQRYLINGSLSAYIDPPETHQEIFPKETMVQNDILTRPDAQNDILTRPDAQNDILTRPDAQNDILTRPDSQNDKFNFLENKLIDTNSLSVDATNMVKNKLMDTMMKTVKNSKYGKMIPSKLLSSLV
jgi:hypothetical protein